MLLQGFRAESEHTAKDSVGYRQDMPIKYGPAKPPRRRHTDSYVDDIVQKVANTTNKIPTKTEDKTKFQAKIVN